MNKILDLDKTVYELVKEYPELKDIMVEIGFKDIVNPVALNLMGRHMTIKKGSQVKDIPLDKTIKKFEENGFVIKDKEIKEVDIINEPKTKKELLKSYIQRLNNGEDIETIREEFVNNFESVSVHDIINVEQGMINDGTPVEDVQRLCDLHSALFHGRTEAEIYFEEEQKEKAILNPGHPVNILKAENRGLEQLLDNLDNALEADDVNKIIDILPKLKKIKLLYGKKEELIMPILYRYDVKGPSDVMWGVDDEIKAEYSRLLKEVNKETYQSLKPAIKAVLDRTKEMIYKEENILFPLALDKFSLDEWVDIYQDIDEMGSIYIDTYPKWDYAEYKLEEREENTEEVEGYINFEGGKLSIKELNALFKILPIDITFIDINENNQFFSNEGKVFSRPKSALGRKVFECHPPRIVPIVKELIKSFKEGTLDKREVWTPNPINPIKVTYLAVRDEDGTYLGTVELVQQFKEDLAHLRGK